MLISDEKGFVFVHVQKAAGSSVTAALKPHALPRPPTGWYSVLRAFDLPRDYHRYRFPKHCGIQEAQKKMPDERFQAYFKFAFVRNPWDRLVSMYNAEVKKNRKRRHRRVRAMSDFSEFLRYAIRHRMLQQHPLILDHQERVGVDFLGYYENLAEDYAVVRDRLELDVELPRLNAFDHKPYREYYTDQTRALVARYWARDIELLGYEF